MVQDRKWFRISAGSDFGTTLGFKRGSESREGWFKGCRFKASHLGFRISSHVADLETERIFVRFWTDRFSSLSFEPCLNS